MKNVEVERKVTSFQELKLKDSTCFLIPFKLAMHCFEENMKQGQQREAMNNAVTHFGTWERNNSANTAYLFISSADNGDDNDDGDGNCGNKNRTPHCKEKVNKDEVKTLLEPVISSLNHMNYSFTELCSLSFAKKKLNDSRVNFKVWSDSSKLTH